MAELSQEQLINAVARAINLLESDGHVCTTYEIQAYLRNLATTYFTNTFPIHWTKTLSGQPKPGKMLGLEERYSDERSETHASGHDACAAAHLAQESTAIFAMW